MGENKSIARPHFGWVLVRLSLLLFLVLAVILETGSWGVDTLPQTELALLDGTPTQLVADKPTVLTVFTTWCGYCQRQLPMFEQVAHRYPKVQFAFVNDGESPTLVQQFHSTREFSRATVYHDQLRQISSTLRVKEYPANFFFGSNGKLVKRIRGYVSQEQLEAALEQIN